MHVLINATEFKAKCLGLIDRVTEQGDTFTITKRGKAVATLVAVKQKKSGKLGGSLAGLVEVPGTVEGFDLSHLYQPGPLLTRRRSTKR